MSDNEAGGKRKPRIVHGRIPTEHHPEHADGGEHCPGSIHVSHLGAAALEAYIALRQPTGTAASAFAKMPADILVKDANGYWGGFFPDVEDGE